MKIALALDDGLDSNDGVQQYVLTIGQYLTEKGHEVHYLVGETHKRQLPHLHSLSRNIKVRFNGNRMSMPRPVSRRKLRELLAKEQFDIIHIQMPYSPFFGGRLLKAAPSSTKLVGTFHILPLGNMQRRAAKILAWKTGRTTNKLDQIWSVSKPAQQFAESLGIASKVLPNAVDFKRFQAGARLVSLKNDFTVVFLGRLVPRKGCQQLLEAVAIWQKQTPLDNLKVIICGDGPEHASLEQLVKKLGIQQKVIFTGYLTEKQKINYLAGADMAVFPSLGGESFGIVLVEALAAKAGVVLAGNNPGYSSVMGEVPASLFDPTQPHELAQLLASLYSNPQARAKLHQQQQKMAGQFDIEQVGKKLLSYYQAL